MVSMVVALDTRFGPSEATVRVAPSGMSPPSSVVSVDRKKATLNGPGAVTPLSFLTVLVTANGVPGVTAAGAVTAVTLRSGSATLSVVVLTSWLFVSSASVTPAAGSTRTRILYCPGAVPAGIVTLVVAGLRAPAARPFTVRVTPSAMSDAPLRSAVGARKKDTPKLVVVAIPWFLTVLATATLAPGATTAGVAVTAVTSRSGPTISRVAL